MQSAFDGTRTLLRYLIGTWQGKGRGNFPTMEPFDYHEMLMIEEVPGQPLFTFKQIGLVTTEGRPDHVEIGLIKILDSGEIQFGNIGNGMRAEIMTGTIAQHEESIVIVLDSIVFANDSRMISSRRRIELATDGTLICSMYMETNTTSIQQEHPHLQAVLLRG